MKKKWADNLKFYYFTQLHIIYYYGVINASVMVSESLSPINQRNTSDEKKTINLLLQALYLKTRINHSPTLQIFLWKIKINIKK